MKNDRGFRPRALGEIAIRCADLGAMVTFYKDIIGLELLTGGQREDITFFEIGPGFGGHTTVLALFRATEPPLANGPASSLHHIALSLPMSEQQAVIDWYDRIGQAYRIETFGWIGWRGVFTEDPEGNTVELVSYDAALLDESDA